MATAARYGWITTLLLLASGTRCCSGATVPASAAEHTVVKVTLAAGEQAQVVRLADNRLRPVATFPTDGGVLFTGPPGFYTVIAQPLQLLECEIVASGPAPPPTPPTPTPVPPGPAPNIPNNYGVGLTLYHAAAKVGDPASAKLLSGIFSSAAGRLAGLQSADVVDDINTINAWVRTEIDKQLGTSAAKWVDWRAAAKLALTSAWKSGHTSRDAYIGVLDEISKALGAVR